MSDIALITFKEKQTVDDQTDVMPSSILHINVPSSNDGFELDKVNPPKSPLHKDDVSRDSHGLIHGDRMSAVGTQSLSSEDVAAEFGLHLASREGAVEAIKSRLNACESEGYDVFRIIDTKDVDGLAPLHHAAKFNKREAADALIERGAYIDITGEDSNTPLHVAAKYNCVEVAKLLISRQASVNCRNVYGSTALHFAARRGNTEIACLLIHHPECDIKIKDNGEVTALHQSAISGDVEIFRELVSCGADIYATDKEGENALHFAASEGNTDIIEELMVSFGEDMTDGVPILAKISYINEKSSEDDTALHLACTSGYEDTVKTLISHGANVNARAQGRTAPLHLAAMTGKIPIAEELLCHHAKINIKDEDQMTPLHKAALYGRLDMMKFLIDKGAIVNARDQDNYTPLLAAVWKGKTEAARLLIENGAKLSITDACLKSCLHLAVEYDHPETLTMLLLNGAIGLINATDKDYRTPLHCAALQGNIEAIKILLEQGAKADSGDIVEKTPLHYAAEYGKPICVDLLCDAEHGCLNITDDYGRMPLHLAAINGNIRVIRILVDKGAEIDARDDTNWTPLDYAASNGFFKSMRILLDNDAPVDAQDKNCNTPLHWASMNGHVDCVNLLLDNGADISLRNIHGKNCLDFAVENNQQSICMALVKHDRWREVVDNINKDGSSPMKKLIQVAPNVAEIVMDKCIDESKHSRNHKEFSITYDFRYIDVDPRRRLTTKTFFEPVTMAQYNRQKLLSHPLTKKLIEHKWAMLGRPVYYITLVTYLLFVACVTSIVVIERERDRNEQLKKSNKAAFISKNEVVDSKIFKTVIPILTLIICGINLVKEVVQIILQRKKYFSQGTNYLEWALYISTIFFMLPFLLGKSSPLSFNMKWNAGAISALLTWINLLLFLTRFPYFGLYIVMFVEVLKTVLRVLLVFCIFIIGFALAFFVLLREQKTFSTVENALMKVAVMTIGELEYDNVLTDNVQKVSATTGLPLIPMSGVTYTIYALFLLIMPIILMNLLVGLAVGDIEAVRKTAYIRILKQQVDILHDIGNNYPAFIQRRAHTVKLVVYPNQESAFVRVRKALGYSDEYGYLKEEQAEQNSVENELQAQLNDHHDDLIKQKRHIKDLKNIIREQNNLLKKIAEKLGIQDEDNE